MNLKLRRSRERYFASLVALFLVLFCLPADAVLLKEFVFTGTVVSTESGVPGAEPGDTITGFFTYDVDTLPNNFNTATSQSYNGAVADFSLKFGEYDVAISNPNTLSPFNFLAISNDFQFPNLGLRDQFLLGAQMQGAGPLTAVNAKIDLIALSNTFHDLTIPTFLSLDAFNARSISLRLELGDGSFRTVTGEMTTLNQITGPDPEAPSKPQITDIDPGDQKIHVSVSVADDGGSPIISYNAIATDGTNSFMGASSSSRIMIPGLTNGVAYTLSVTATNAVGTSEVSSISAPVTPEKAVAQIGPVLLLLLDD